MQAIGLLMANILDAGGEKLATMDEDNKVRDLQGKIIGHVLNNGDVLNVGGHKIGEYDDKGDIYEGGHKIGMVRGDGSVFDYNNHCVGKITGGHISSGGAALLLLVR